MATWFSLLLAAGAVWSCDSGGKSTPPLNGASAGAGGDGDGGAGDDDISSAGFKALGGAHAFEPGLPCNGWPQLCERRYDQVTFPVTHAAMADSATFWDYPAQRTDLRKQLDDSIRGLMLEVHESDGAPALCSNDCGEGKAAFVKELSRVTAFLDDNPREVVTLLLDNRLAASDVAQGFEDADLARYLYANDPSGGWPTLAEMIDENTRVVVFLSDPTGAPAGYRSLAEVRATSPAHVAGDLDCATTGDPDAPFVLLLQTLVNETEAPLGAGGAGGTGGAASAAAPVGHPDEALAEEVNHDPFLSERIAECSDFFDGPPSFVAVDFYDSSDVVTAAQRANGLIP